MIMTNREVIETLDEMGDCCSTEPEYVACHIAIEAIEKQTPKKIERRDNHSFCPNCNFCLGNIEVRLRYHTAQKFCPDCGQALNWSEV